MNTIRLLRRQGPRRRAAAAALAALTLAGWGAGGPHGLHDDGSRDLVHAPGDAGFPATLLTGRALDLPAVERSRGGGHGSPGATPCAVAHGIPSAGGATSPARAPAGSALDVRARAGRLSAPATGPPVLS